MTALCELCATSCETCTGPNYNNCKTCVAGFNFYEPNKECITVCPDKFVGINKICESCDATTAKCLTCSVLSTNCTKCVTGSYFYNFGCYANCLAATLVPSPTKNMWGNPVTGKCEECNIACDLCFGPNFDNCTKCTTDYNLVLEKSQCVKDCPASYYASSNQCLKCSYKCLTCKTDSTTCQSCSTGFYYFKDGTTEECTDNCPSKGSYYGNFQTRTCDPCHNGCVTCFGPTANTCTSCKTDTVSTPNVAYYYYEVTRQCLQICPSGYAYSTAAPNVCAKCNISCIECAYNDPNICLSCNSSLFLLGTDCMTKEACPSNTFADTTLNKCVECNPICLTCNDSSVNQCGSCADGYFLNVLTSACASVCPVSYFKVGPPDNKCSPCGTGCKTCDVLSNNCTSCLLGYYLKDFSCGLTCGSHQYKDLVNSKCATCNVACGDCTGPSSSNCIDCQSPYFLFGATCILTCPTGYYGTGVICEKCATECQACTASICTACVSPYFLKNEATCVSACADTAPENQFGDTRVN